jgi:HK97 family phage major capsid protein
VSEEKNISESAAKKLVEAVEFVQEKSNENDGVYRQGIEKANRVSEECVKEIQDLRLKSEAKDKEYQESQKRIEELEKALHRMPGSKDVQDANEQYRKEFVRYACTGKRISDEEVLKITNQIVENEYKGIYDENKKEMVVKDLVAGINPQGGYWIRPERTNKIVSRIFETSPMRSIASVETTSSDSVELIIDDNQAASGGWVGELDSRPETETPDIGLLTMPVHEHYAQPIATQKMIDDAGFDVEGWLSRKVADVLSREENTAFVSGDGSAKPKGFLDYEAWASPGVYQRNAIEQINSGNPTLFTADGIIDVWTSLKEAYQPRAVWLTKRASFGEIVKLKDNEGQYLLNPRVLSEGADMLLLGKRLMFADDMETVGAGNLALAYGDFSVGYEIRDRIGFRLIRDDITTKGKVKFYTTKRTTGAVTNFEAIKLQVISA